MKVNTTLVPSRDYVRSLAMCQVPHNPFSLLSGLLIVLFRMLFADNNSVSHPRPRWMFNAIPLNAWSTTPTQFSLSIPPSRSPTTKPSWVTNDSGCNRMTSFNAEGHPPHYYVIQYLLASVIITARLFLSTQPGSRSRAFQAPLPLPMPAGILTLLPPLHISACSSEAPSAPPFQYGSNFSWPHPPTW
jgi:hypothetical protein